MQSVTWKWVRESKLSALVAMAKRAGLVDTDEWHLTDGSTPFLVASNGARFCQWADARECAEYLQAWIDALSLVATEREDRAAVLRGYVR